MAERKKAELMRGIIFAGGPQAGFLTNPESKNLQNYIEVNEEKIVCLAQGGECRYNPKYFTPEMNDVKSWTTPIIDELCPDECIFKMLVCDNHPENCKGSSSYNSQYNKFRGQFHRYCRNFSKLESKSKISPTPQ